jgi:phospholipase C
MLSTAAPMPGFADNGGTKTPIKHVVVIFFENESFDHYFGTYPSATNSDNEPRFVARDDTPAVNNLLSNNLLTNNPNLRPPYRMDRSEAFSCDMDHDYTDEQKAVNGGLMDKFVQSTASIGLGCRSDGSTVMAYFDGNTVTALWNYAQNFAMSDNSFGTMYGPSTVGAINLVSGQTGNAVLAKTFARGKVNTSSPLSTITGDPDPALDDCGADAGGTKTPGTTVQMASGKNIGDLLNAKHITWGWFQGGFAATSPAVVNADGSTATPAKCATTHLQHEYIPPGRTTPVLVVPNPTAQDGQTNPPTDIHTATADYVPHHAPFQYYASTRNPHHLRPSPDTPQQIGRGDQANHQYDMSDFFNALSHGNLSAVSYLKPPKYQNAHPGNSDPLLEQVFLVQVVNANDSLQPALPLSTSTAVATPEAITTSGVCGTAPAGAPPGAGRCGYGPRLPFLVISPWARENYIDHTVIDQASSLRFIEDNWQLGTIDGTTLPSGQSLGSFSFDQLAGSIMSMFDFDDHPSHNLVILDPLTGRPTDNDHADNGHDGHGHF